MKKLVTVISSALLLAGVANAQDTIELSSAQMDQVNAGAATAYASSTGNFEVLGLFNIAGSSSYTDTDTFDSGNFSAGSAYATSSTGAFTFFGANAVNSQSYASVIVIE
jgi:hypothetical protein